MYSVFTPTHNTQFLCTAYASLKNQRGPDWEWLIVRNGDNCGDVPEEARHDPRVRVLDYPRSQQLCIGALKKFACEACRGDYLVELDHDDMLQPDALLHVAAAFDAGADFVYSDALLWNEASKESVLFDAAAGWEYRKIAGPL